MSYEQDKEFQRCVLFVLERECGKNKDGSLRDGYVNDPVDAGGETKYGISKRSFPSEDIKNLSLSKALEIYYKYYWQISKSEPFPVNLVLFDSAVQHGTKRAAKYLLAYKQDWKKMIEDRREFYLSITKNNPSQKKFLKGWMNRLNELRKFIDVEMNK